MVDLASLQRLRGRTGAAPRKLVQAAARTGNFAVRAARLSAGPGRNHPELPMPQTTLPRLASVFLEELILIFAAEIDERILDDDEVRRMNADTDTALALFAEHGWLDDPAGYHQEPTAPDVFTLEPAAFLRTRYQELVFDSGYEPTRGLPGRDRWLAMAPNRSVHAYVMEHRSGGPRPWLLFLHGHGMGRPMDLTIGEGLRYHRDLGFNVIAPVLPLQGPRSGEVNMVSLDWVSNVHGLTQAVWDVRRCLAWIRARGATSIAVHGMSLGGYAAAMVASLDADLACVVSGVPAAAIHSPVTSALARNPAVRRMMERNGIIDDRTEIVHRVVTPTALPCLVPPDRRFIYAGLADRLSKPSQAYQLWEHWDRPSIYWSQSSHLVTMLSPRVRKFVRDSVEASVGRGSAPLVSRPAAPPKAS